MEIVLVDVVPFSSLRLVDLLCAFCYLIKYTEGICSAVHIPHAQEITICRIKQSRYLIK